MCHYWYRSGISAARGGRVSGRVHAPDVHGTCSGVDARRPRRAAAHRRTRTAHAQATLFWHWVSQHQELQYSYLLRFSLSYYFSWRKKEIVNVLFSPYGTPFIYNVLIYNCFTRYLVGVEPPVLKLEYPTGAPPRYVSAVQNAPVTNLPLQNLVTIPDQKVSIPKFELDFYISHFKTLTLLNKKNNIVLINKINNFFLNVPCSNLESVESW